MTQIGEFLASHGLMLLIGASMLLGAGAIALLLQRSPIHRQRVAELTILCVLAWVVLACIPLPRWSDTRAASKAVAAAPQFHAESYGHARASSFDADWESTLRSLVRFERTTPAQPQAIAAQEWPGEASSFLPRSEPMAAGNASSWRGASWSVVARTTGWAYFTCAVGCAAWLTLGHLFLWRIIKRAGQPKPWLAELFEESCGAVGVRRARLLVADTPVRPGSCGILRPTVLICRQDCSPDQRERLRQVLLHEAAHLRQRDAWGNALFNLAMPLLYAHPLYWLLRSEASVAREMVADSIAAQSTSRSAYASDLLELARARVGHRAAVPAAVAMFHSPSHFYRRMHMLLRRNTQVQPRCSMPWRVTSGAVCAGVLLLAMATLGLGRAAAQEAKGQEQDRKSVSDSAAGAKTPDGDTTDAIAKTVSDPAAGAKTPDGDTTDDTEKASKALKEYKAAYDRAGSAERLADLEKKLAMLGKMHAQAEQELKEKQLEVEKLRELLARSQPDMDALNDLAKKAKAGAADSAYAKYTKALNQNNAEEQGFLRNQYGAKDPNQKSSFWAKKPDGDQAAEAGVGKGAGFNQEVSSLRPQLDLVALASSYADATSSIEAAREELNSANDRRESAIAKAKVAAAERKAMLLRSIAEAALQQAQDELAIAQKLVEQGAAPHSHVFDAEGRVRILSLILKSGQGGGPYDANAPRFDAK